MLLKVALASIENKITVRVIDITAIAAAANEKFLVNPTAPFFKIRLKVLVFLLITCIPI